MRPTKIKEIICGLFRTLQKAVVHFFVKLESNNAIPKTLEVPWDLKSLHLQILSQNSIRFAKNQCMNDYKISIKVCMMHKVINNNGFQRKSHFCCRFLDQKY